ncbi:MAG TPA: protocatechuate 3,4-dioxygenase subunit alpha [Solirubrobacteraceae bacterium]|nr:protocatechuate 3,4-dioxygenase subunit alpha [Solirubrobacteraceae bacterium]
MSLTPSQTVGPFFSIGLPWPGGPYVVPEDSPGATRITGCVYDGAGEPITDSLVETWQADPEGGFGAAEFRGFGRAGREAGDGTFEIVTVKPGQVPGPDGTMQAPHIDVSVFARGMLQRCVTRIYFADEQEANDRDPVLASVPAERRATLLAVPQPGGYRFDIHLQGPGETVFFRL